MVPPIIAAPDRARARALADDMTVLLRELVQIESPSEHPEGVAAVAARLGDELRRDGFVSELVPVRGAGPILRARGGDGDGPVMLLGHLDTVWPRGTLAARPVTIDEGVLRGPGAYDMKAGLVVAVFALRLLAARGARPPVTVFFTPLEEVGCEPYRPLMEAEMRAAAAVLDFEPAWPGGAVKTARKGSGSFVLTARGRAAHAGADYRRGASAVAEIARQILSLHALTDLDRGVTVNVGVVRGGIRPNVVAEEAHAEVDVRYPTAGDGERLETTLRALRPADPRVTLALEGGLHYPPLERAPHVLAVYERARAVARALGHDLPEVSTGGASEASFAAALGVPTLDGLGADGDGAHAEDEHVLLGSLPGRAALAAGLIESLAADPPAPRP